MNGIDQDGLFAYTGTGAGQRYEIWPVDQPNDPSEVWALRLVDDNDSEEDLGRFDTVGKAQLDAELHHTRGTAT
ncbi:hypothetical protein AWC23_11585 [Mycobacterium saskatchewanense]|uniref:Uncharacterized protein n=1 Tax=Mycobacterium saskatchewanense TaxID=220927 RepID=A0AAJ3NRG8_9MYCO|nr:hypothetical protein AWC23_11585 [Mycobacterium saskatchewanense]